MMLLLQRLCFSIGVCLLLSPVLYSQTVPFIKGTLVDSLTAEPLAFAALRLESKTKSNVVKGEVADEKGSFQFVGLKDDKYVIRVEYVGYKTKYVEVSYDNARQRLDLGAIVLSPVSQDLETVTVTGLKPNVVTTLEKQVFRAEQFEVAKGGTATDVLKNIPSVMVNAEGEITVRGSKGFLILINGKPTQVDIATILAQIPANTIEKIEMITAPSAKYDADGKAGIINIVTKKGTNDGFSLTSNVQYGLPRIREYANATEPQRYGADASINYRKGKWDAAFSVNYLKNDIAGRREGEVSTTLNNVLTQFPSDGERSFNRQNYGLRASATYTISPSDEISAGLYWGKRDQYRTADIYYNNTKTNVLTQRLVGRAEYFNANLVLKSGAFKVYNLDYTHKFKNASTITFSGLYEDATVDGYTKNRNLNPKNFRDTLQYTLNTGNNPLKALRLKADYEKQIGIGKLSVGYQFRRQQQDGVFAYWEKSGNNTPLMLNPAFSAQVAVRNQIHGWYTQYAGRYRKIEFSSGLRYENALREFVDSRSSTPNVLKLSNLFPSANVLYDLGKELKIKVAYSRRVQRSTNNELNPYPEREHSETLEQGDPNIRPEFIGIYEAGVTKDFKKGAFYWNVYRQQITDIVNRVNSVYNDTILNRIYTNAGKARLMGSEFGLTLAPVKKLKLFLGGNLYQLKINGALFDNTVAVNSRGWVYSINSNLTYQITPSLSTQFTVLYLSARNTAQGEDSRFYQPNFSLKKALWKNRVSVSMLWQNAALGAMKVNEQRITTRGSNFYTTTNYVQERNIFLLNLSYNFNKTDRKAKLPSSEFGEREF
ncbi:outer membrane beta-barrel family protein [Runella slithyformis]|uniref:TonB-dependent receptor plug n=1 Tax=Runella slithyformis (strain ATCC 29530 / DSM 19594 / LMG 11500 / NCIMB 11436 / LSU 4) TaxID=761193 RepID=A0A7U3ZGP2_RUNSL|nr:outer membrane beta-barrel family protein [Runella slithyformis]AEI46896.1 TonB-dependent receptor plug [Runella slithyformis DSM 19594]